MNRITLLVLTVILSSTIFSYGQVDELKINNQEPPSSENGEIWYKVDVSPSFPGGFPKFYEYVNKNLKYPKDARKQELQGKVMVEFVVDSTGVIRPETVNVVRGLLKSCDEEAIRLIKGSPNWVPGRVTELRKNVPVKMVLPITFRL